MKNVLYLFLTATLIFVLGSEISASSANSQLGNCPTEIIALPAPSCYSFYFEVNNNAFGNFIWDFSDAGSESSGTGIDHTFPGPGTYTVCANPMSMDCDPLCLEVEVGACADCNLDVEIVGDGCGLYVMEAYNYPEGAQILWHVNDEPVNVGHITTFNFEENGTYQVCAIYESFQCPDGAEWCETFVVDCNGICEDNEVLIGIDSYVGEGGPEFIELSLSNSDNEVLFDGNAVYSAQQMYFDWDGCLEDGCYELNIYSNSMMSWENVLVSFAVNGESVEPLYGSSNGFNTEWTLAINSECEPQCNGEIEYALGEGGSINFWNPLATEDLGYSWSINGDLLADGPEYQTTLEPGTYVVCLQIYGGFCEEEICQEITIPADGCPTQLWVGEGQECGQFVFETSNFQEGESAFWDFGDNNFIQAGGHFASHTYEEAGTYTVTVVFTSNDCPLGVTLTAIVEVPECENNCELGVEVINQGCGLYVMEAYGYPENAQIFWTSNTEIVNVGHITTFNFEENGAYQVCAFYETPECPLGAEWCESFFVDCQGQNECPETIWSGAGEECGDMNFEIGSFSPGEEVIWFFGDGESQEGGHFIQHNYSESGTYFVSAVYYSNACPDGVELWTTIEVDACDDDCTPVGFAFDSFVQSNGPEFIEYTLVNAFGDVIFDGSAEYSENDPYHDAMACLPDGCYEMIIEANSTLEQVEFFSAAFIDGVQLPIFDVYSGTNSMSYEFSVNSDCNPECTEFSITMFVDPSNDGPDYQLYTIFDSEGNIVAFGGEVNDITEPAYVTSSFCLPDGCYYIQNDGSCCVNYGSNFGFIGSDNVSFGNYEAMDQVAGIIPFSLNGGCEWDEGCEPVQLTVSGTFVGEAIVEWVLESDEYELSGLLPLDALLNGEFVLDWCLPQECFSLSFQSDGPLPMEFLLLEVFAEELQQELGAIEMEFGEDFITLEFGWSEDCVTSINEEEAGKFKIYPNPSETGMITLEWEAMSSNAQLYVHDITGRLVHSETVNQTVSTIDLAKLTAGLYEVSIINGSESISRKLILTK